MLERYLATPTLPSDDREEATQQLEALRRRTSTVTIASLPDGRGRHPRRTIPAEGTGKTPTSFTVQPGQHTITLSVPKRAVYTQTFDARYGRAIILDVPLKEDGQGAAPPTNPYGEGEIRRVALRGDLGVMLPRYGSVGGAAHATLTAQRHVSLRRRRRDDVRDRRDVPPHRRLVGQHRGRTGHAAPCGTLTNPRSAPRSRCSSMGTAGWEIVPRLRAHAIAGVGIAAIFADDLGGDVFVSACSPSPGPRPAMMFGGQLDYALTPVVRLSALPLVLQLQPVVRGNAQHADRHERRVDACHHCASARGSTFDGDDMTVSTLFDFNGVLVDDESVHLAAFREVVAPLGIVIDDATYAERYLGFDDAGAFRAMLADAGAEAVRCRGRASRRREEAALHGARSPTRWWSSRAPPTSCAVARSAVRSGSSRARCATRSSTRSA